MERGDASVFLDLLFRSLRFFRGSIVADLNRLARQLALEKCP
jgi:hypothetical protein